MTGGALVAPPGPSSIAESRLPTPEPAVKGASAARVRSEGRMVRRGTSRPVGSPSVPAPRNVDLDGQGDGVKPTDGRGPEALPWYCSPPTEYRTAAVRLLEACEDKAGLSGTRSVNGRSAAHGDLVVGASHHRQALRGDSCRAKPVGPVMPEPPPCPAGRPREWSGHIRAPCRRLR
jgi:hypothetical protein